MRVLKEIMEDYPDLLEDVKSNVYKLLIARGNSTVSELKQDYANYIGDGWLPDAYDEIVQLLKEIPGVVSRTNVYGTVMWTVSRARNKRPSSRNSNPSEGNRQNKRQKVHQKEGYFHNFQLVGDDFFYDLLTRDLKTPSRTDPRNGRNYAGMCETGLTIKLAEQKIFHNRDQLSKNMLVHIGAIDITLQRDFYSIKRDLESFMRACKSCQINPIICTITPLASTSFNKKMVDTLKAVNNFICAQDHWNVLDLHQIFVTYENRVDYNLFCSYAKHISGVRSKFHISTWNQKGRSSVLEYVKQVIIDHNYSQLF